MQNPGIMPDKKMDACIQQIADGEIAALEELYGELRVPVYRIALSIVKSPDLAEDVAQETFLRLRESAQTYRPKGKPRAWIFSIVRNLAVSELRQAVNTIDILELSEALELSENPAEIEDLSLLDILTPAEKEIVTLHVLADLKHSEIAKTLNIHYEQARWKYTYAIQKMKKHLEQKKGGRFN